MADNVRQLPETSSSCFNEKNNDDKSGTNEDAEDDDVDVMTTSDPNSSNTVVSMDSCLCFVCAAFCSVLIFLS